MFIVSKCDILRYARTFVMHLDAISIAKYHSHSQAGIADLEIGEINERQIADDQPDERIIDTIK